VPDADDADYGYKVELDEFSGPLDLLLYLIRQEEVDITSIPIARITDQYLAHLDVLQLINVDLAGEFLLMAATLMEIKSRMLLPKPELEEDEEDPRADLIRQLLEYKRFKDAARRLAGRADEQALKFGRGRAAILGLPEPEPQDDLPIDIGELTVWDLVAAFRTILQQTSVRDVTRQISLDDRPLTNYCNDLLDKVRGRPIALFTEVFDPGAGRMALISTFLALLELMKRRRLRAEQGARAGEIRLVILDDSPVTAAELIESTAPPAPPAPEPAPEPSDAAPPAEAAAPEPAAAGPSKPWRRSRPRADLPLLTDEDDEFGLDAIDVPPLRLEPEPGPQPPSTASPASPPSRRSLRPPPKPTVLTLLRRHRPSRRRVRPAAIRLRG